MPKRLKFGNDTRTQLLHALTQYDIKLSKSKHYNQYALGIYLDALNRTMILIEQNFSIRDAIKANFCGRLLNVCFKAVGEPKATDEELRG